MAADLRSVSEDDIRAQTGRITCDELLLAGCAPCQPFSKQRARNGVAGHSDESLLMEFARLVQALQPKAILMENVPGIGSEPGVGALSRFLQILRDCGFDPDPCVLNARDFGVPQHRRRYVLLAVLGGLALLPEAEDVHSIPKGKTVRDAIERFPAIEAGETNRFVPNHGCSRLSPLNMKRIKATPPDGGSRRDWPRSLVLECHRHGEHGFSDVYGRMWWDRVAPTLTSRCNSLSNGRFGHPEQDRAISLREAASLQSFSDDYEFFGSTNRIARWIGNAVPVQLAEALGVTALKAVT